MLRQEQKSDKGPNPAECPISLETMGEVGITPCDHAFDLKNINQHIEKQHDCPTCRADIKTPLQKSKAATNLVIHITQQDWLIEAKDKIIAEQEKIIEQLKAELAAAKQTIKTLTLPESKSQGQVPIESQIASAKNTALAQHIADAEYLQKITYSQKTIRGFLARKRIPELLRQHTQIKSEKKELLTAHSKKQSDINSLLQQLTNQLNTGNRILNEKKDDPEQLYQTIRKKVDEGQLDNQTFSNDKKDLRWKYVSHIAPELKKGLYLFHSWVKTKRKVVQQMKELKSLRQNQEQAFAETTALVHQQTQTTLSLFGGLKEPKRILPVGNQKEFKQLVEAVKSSNYNQAKKLLGTLQFDLKKRIDGLTLLAIAIKNSHIEMMKLLIANGASVNSIIQGGVTQGNRALPLVSFIISETSLSTENKKTMLTMLLQHRAVVNLADNFDDTPLHWAAWRQDRDAIQILQKFKANPELVNKSKHTPVQTALDYQRQHKAPSGVNIDKINELLARGEAEAKKARVPDAPSIMPSVASSSYNPTPPLYAAAPALQPRR